MKTREPIMILILLNKLRMSKELSIMFNPSEKNEGGQSDFHKRFSGREQYTNNSKVR